MKIIKLFVFLLISIYFASCTKDEKILSIKLHDFKEIKKSLILSHDLKVISTARLLLLKKYSDEMEDGVHVFKGLMSKDRKVRRFQRYLKKNGGHVNICSDLLLTSNELKNFKSHCMEGVFEICPVSFNRYEKNKKILLDTLRKVLGNRLEETDCEIYAEEKK